MYRSKRLKRLQYDLKWWRNIIFSDGEDNDFKRFCQAERERIKQHFRLEQISAIDAKATVAFNKRVEAGIPDQMEATNVEESDQIKATKEEESDSAKGPWFRYGFHLRFGCVRCRTVALANPEWKKKCHEQK